MSTLLGGTSVSLAEDDGPRVEILSNEEAWKLLPVPTKSAGQPLPTWARMMARELPRTTAAFLQLDLAHRAHSPLPPDLRAAMRWISAHVNRCAYGEAYAVADAARAGVDATKINGLGQPKYPGWSDEHRAALEFARKMSADSDSVTDAEFTVLVKHFGEKRAACMVLLMAYSNFQDRLLLCLGAPVEEGGPAPAVDLSFPAEAFVVHTTPPPPLKKTPLPAPTGKDAVTDDPEWTSLSYDLLQQRLESQRRKPTRLRVPEWDEVARNLPEGLMQRPSDIVWYRIVFGYAPELAVPFELVMRTAGAEGSPKWDRIFGQGLFWVTTKAVKCPYCMGHCEMNWEVAGLTPDEIAARSRLLSGDDWSSFPAAEQHAYAFARKLSQTPWEISNANITELNQDFGPDRAMLIMLNASRYHYMTRISNGFQLTLERENVFYDYYNVKPTPVAGTFSHRPEVAGTFSHRPDVAGTFSHRPDVAGTFSHRSGTESSSNVGTGTKSSSYAVPLLSDAECWKRMPKTVQGTGQPLPNWARAVAGLLPRTAAAMLQLDLAQRTKSPIDPVLRAKMRWVIAHANRCGYSEAYALADLKRSGTETKALETLQGAPAAWPEADREPLEFARLLTVAAPTIPDELFAKLRSTYGDKQVAAMVLLGAYGNFQDRIVLGLNLPLEAGGPLAPVDVQFEENAFQVAPFVPPQSKLTPLADSGNTVVPEDPEWSQISYDELQSRLEHQRDRKPRLPVPTWDEVKQNLPPAMAARPTKIVWNLVCSGYVPELAVPWSISTRTMWSETHSDRVFEESLFWIQTRSIGCNYCMGHCEMLLEVAGLDKQGIAERTRRLASSDWSAFPPAEQRAYAYARKLSKTPWELTPADYAALETDLGPEKAMATFWWLCRGLYMTRVSDGFQLPLERENVFEPLK